MTTAATASTHAGTDNGSRAAIIATMTERRIPSLTVAVTGRDGLLYAEAFGKADLAGDRAATPDTRYLWFSMSKVATATAAVRLADEGRLDLDAPFTEYVQQPGSARTSHATVRHLLTHTAGLPNPLPVNWVHPPGGPDRDDELLDRLLPKHVEPKYPVGELARYSNLGYLILGRVITTASGMPFKRYIRTEVLEPIGMNSTDYGDGALGDVATGYIGAPRVATPFLKAILPSGTLDTRYDRHLALHPFLVDGAAYGGVVGSVTDAARFAQLHLGDGELGGVRVLATESAQRMRRIVYPGRPFDHGIAWFRNRRHDPREPFYVQHYGTGAGYWNAMRLYPELGLGMVIMANTTAAYDVDNLFSSLVDQQWPA